MSSGKAAPKPMQSSSSSPLLTSAKWLNWFQYCKVLTILGQVMVLIVLAFIGLIYMAVVPLTYGPVVLQAPARPLAATGALLVCAVFTAMVSMVVWCYMYSVLTDPGRVPQHWHGFADDQVASVELERLMYTQYYHDRRDPRRPRYCKHCQCWKPERSHHCSALGRCVLKLDHYCIWIVNSVGLLNYKAFLLFLAYSMVGCATAALLLIRPAIRGVTTMPMRWSAPLLLVVLIISGAFSLSILGFLAMHAQLLAANHTTIEMYEKDRCHPWPYNKGFKRNFEEVFGRNKLRWLVPHMTCEERRHLLEAALGPAWVNTALGGGGSGSGGAAGGAGREGGAAGGAPITARLLPQYPPATALATNV